MKPLLLFSLLLASLIAVRADVPAASTASASDVAAPPSPTVDPAKDAQIREMIERSGVKESFKVVMDHMIETFKTKYPTVPAEFWTQMESDSSMDDLISRLVPIYSQFYSLDDLKAINAFYGSPVGQHMRQVQPQIVGAATLVGRQWGREMGAKIMSGVLAQQAKTYAAEDKSTYYTTPSTNASPTPAPAPAAK